LIILNQWWKFKNFNFFLGIVSHQTENTRYGNYIFVSFSNFIYLLIGEFLSSNKKNGPEYQKNFDENLKNKNSLDFYNKYS